MLVAEVIQGRLSNMIEFTVHNKVMVIDQATVITGSFNFTNSAASRNAENYLVLKSADLAEKYRLQWQNHWQHAVE